MRYGIPLLLTIACLSVHFILLDLGLSLPARRYASIIANALVTLPGFYIAALAAVSSFNSPSLDKEIEGGGAVSKLLTKGKMVSIRLMYRMYITYLFSYLTCASLLLYVLLSLSPDVSDLISRQSSPNLAAIMNYIGSYALLALFWNLTIVSLHGIYFLAERMHRPYA